MPEHIRALIVIVFFATTGFAFAKKLVQHNVTNTDFNKWRNVWFAVVVTAFLAHNFWVYLLVSSMFIVFFTKQVKNKMALFFILLFVIPPIGLKIPGLGLVNYITTITHPRFIILLILLPAAISISRSNQFKFTKIWTDKFLLLYLLVVVGLEFRDTTFTDSLRKCFNTFIDVFLPYYVASRGVKDMQQMKTVMAAFVTSAIVIAFIAVFESAKHWILYYKLGDALGTGNFMSNYLGRSGEVRAVATLGHPIILGYFMTIALGFYLHLSQYIQQKTLKRLGFILIILGLLAPLSRGPWVGAAAMIVVYLLYGPSAVKKVGLLAFAAMLSFFILSALPGGQKYVNLIPFIGETEKSTITYREQLFKNSMIVIDRNPFFGSSNYLETPEMQKMIQGQGIIDIVNSYLRVTLETGYVGLALFVSVFISTILRVRYYLNINQDKKNPLHNMGRSLIAILVGIMLTIATASSISTVPIVYWSLIGLAIAYAQIVKVNLQQKEASAN